MAAPGAATDDDDMMIRDDDEDSLVLLILITIYGGQGLYTGGESLHRTFRLLSSRATMHGGQSCLIAASKISCGGRKGEVCVRERERE